MSGGLSGNGCVTGDVVVRAIDKFGSPLFIYDRSRIVKNCRSVLSIPAPFGLEAGYAMKANPVNALIRLTHSEGLHIDASSLREVERANRAGVPYSNIKLTSQDVPNDEDSLLLKSMMKEGLKYDVCSLRQLKEVSGFAKAENIPLSIRVHPGEGGVGETKAQNTASNYASFGVHIFDLEEAVSFAVRENVIFDEVHVHVGSGGDSEGWKAHVDRQLGLIEENFPFAHVANFGGGFKAARMPSDSHADLTEIGGYTAGRLIDFFRRTGRELKMKVEPGSYIIADAGYLAARVIDKKSTGEGGFSFLILDAGMDLNTRPLLYGSEHPFYVLSRSGRVLSAEQDLDGIDTEFIVDGRCCESGDSQCIDAYGEKRPRVMAEPDVGDVVVIGGVGAYCSGMNLGGYNSYLRPAEVLAGREGILPIVKKQSLEQLTQNELEIKI